MNVTREDLDGTRMQRLVVVEARGSDHVRGEVAAYFCPLCERCDETLQQIYHAADCPFAGQHGRVIYDEGTFGPDPSSPELRGRVSLTMIKIGQTEGRGGFCAGEVLGFQCEGCGNSDERADQIIHDDRCPLSQCGD